MATIRPNAEPAATSVAAGDIFLIDGATGVRALAAASVAVRDANGNVALNNPLEGFATTVTAAGTTILTAASPKQQYFTGSTTQIVQLPVTSTLVLGQAFSIKNGSSGVLTVNSSGGNLVATVAPGASITLTCVLITGTSAASWLAPVETLAWTPYTPTVTGAAGLFTTVSGAGRYTQIGKTVFFEVIVTITTNGTASTATNVALPVNAKTVNTAFSGRENTTAGVALVAWISSATNLRIQKYDGTYIGADGFILSVSGSYEAA